MAGGRSKSSLGHSGSSSTYTKLPVITSRHGSAGLPSDARPTKKTWKGQPDVSNEVRSIVRMYKEVAKPDSKGLTKTDFRNLFFKSEPGERRVRDKKLQDELSGDMFRALDKDGDGYVMLQDLLQHFVPKQQLKRMPADFIGSVMNRRKKVVVTSTETPRLPRHGVEEIRDIYDLWVSYSHEVGDKEGKLDRNALIEILAGRRNAEFSWMEAREAADRIFSELPSASETISLGDMANHLQEVLFVNWSQFNDGSVIRFKKHPRVDVDFGTPTSLSAQKKDPLGYRHPSGHSGALVAGITGMTGGITGGFPKTHAPNKSTRRTSISKAPHNCDGNSARGGSNGAGENVVKTEIKAEKT